MGMASPSPHGWLAAMGIDPPHPHGFGRRSLLGHRLLCVLRTGPKSMRDLHAATGRSVPAAQLREALRELESCGLLAAERGKPGPKGGRPREVWRLLYPGSSAIAVAAKAVAHARAQGFAPRRRRAWRPPTIQDLRRTGVMPPEGGRRPRRSRRPVPQNVADEVVAWICEGRYLRDYSRQPGTPSVRTIYNWARKDPEFGRRLKRARDIGEDCIREEYAEYLSAASAAFAGGRKARREFNLFIRPIDLRLQRWRRHPRRRVTVSVIPG